MGVLVIVGVGRECERVYVVCGCTGHVEDGVEGVREAGRTVSFSTIGAVPWIAEFSNVSMEESRC